jgi:hypothetical protein
MVEEQSAARAICERLGFQLEGRFGCHVRDRQGRCHNLVVRAFHLPLISHERISS